MASFRFRYRDLHNDCRRRTFRQRKLVDQIKPSAIVHAAGPYFAIGSAPLEVAIEARIPYVDLCPRGVRYVDLQRSFSDTASKAGLPIFVGASTVGGITGLMTRRATEQMDHVESVETVLLVHNFGWGGGLVSDCRSCVSRRSFAEADGSSSNRIGGVRAVLPMLIQ